MRESPINKSISIIFYILLFILPLVIFPFINDSVSLAKITVLRLLVFILLILILIRIFKEKRVILYSTPLDIPILFLFISNLYACIFSFLPVLSFWGMYRFYFAGFYTFTIYVLLFYIVTNSKEIKSESIMKIILFSSFFVSVYGLLQYIGLDFFYKQKTRIISTLGNPNFLGAYMAMVIPLTLGMFFEKRNTVFYFLLILFLSVLSFTGSRASMLATVFSIVLFFYFVKEKIKNKGKITIIFALLIIVIIISPLRNRFFTMFNLNDTNITSRIKGYIAVLKVIKEHPFLGTGLDTLTLFFRQKIPKDFLKVTPILSQAGYAHNFILQRGLETGIIGLGIFIWFIIVAFRVVYRQCYSRENPNYILVGVLCSLSSLLIQSLFSFSVITTSVLFWVLLGIGIKEEAKKRKEIIINKKILYGLTIPLIFIVLYLKPLIINPVVADYYFLKGKKENNLFLKIKYLSEATAFFNKLPQYYISLGKAYYVGYKENVFSKKELEKASISFKTAIRINPYSALSYNGLGLVYLSLSKENKDNELYKLGMQALKKAVLLDPFLVPALVNLAFEYEKKQETKKAEEYYLKAISIDPSNELARFNLGCIYARENKKEKAIYQWKKVLEINPLHHKAQQYLKILQ